MELLSELLFTALKTLRDVLPIFVIIIGFQAFVLRRAIPHFRQVLLGVTYVIVGLTLFLVGLEEALFPLGDTMAQQLTDPAFIHGSLEGEGERIYHWSDFMWVYLFASAIGFACTIAEPALIAVALKAEHVSGGTVSVWGLRVAVAIGASIGITLGTFRIVTGTPLHYYIIVGYIVVVIQTWLAPRAIIPLAYDSGGVTTSTVTVPLVAALGLGLASTVPGRSPLLDGFGLIAFVCLFPIITVMGYAQIGEWWVHRAFKAGRLENKNKPDN